MQQDQKVPRQRAISITTALLITNVVCFGLQWIGEQTLYDFDQKFALSPWGLMQARVYQLITFQFLHANFLHLFGNLFTLFFFGRAVEEMLGAKRMLKVYFLSGCVGGLMQVALGFVFPYRYGGAVLGASAGVFGLVAVFATLAPKQPVTLLLFFVLPITFPAKVLLLIEASLGIFGLIADSGHIAHAAHLGGMLTGIIYARRTISRLQSSAEKA